MRLDQLGRESTHQCLVILNSPNNSPVNEIFKPLGSPIKGVSVPGVLWSGYSSVDNTVVGSGVSLAVEVGLNLRVVPTLE